MQHPYGYPTYPYTQTSDTVTSGGSAVSTSQHTTNLDTLNRSGTVEVPLTPLEPDPYGNDPVYLGHQPSMIWKSPAQNRDNAEDFGRRTGCSWPHNDNTVTRVGDNTLRMIPRDANSETERWINRFKMIQAFRSALESVKESMSTRQPGDAEWESGLSVQSLPYVERAIKSIADYEVTEGKINNWSFAGTSEVGASNMVRKHKDIREAWNALTSPKGPVFEAVESCNDNCFDLSALKLRFETVGGSLYADYTHFKALKKIWPQNTPSHDVDM